MIPFFPIKPQLKVQRVISGACAVVLSVLGATLNAQPTEVSGTIAGQTWTLANSPYQVVGNTFIAGLTIQPGVQVIFQSNYVFEVDGTLTALGTAAAPIIFTTTNGGWQGILFNDAANTSVLDYCVISNSVNSGIRITNTSVTLSNCLIASNTTLGNGGGIVANNSAENVVLQNCIVINNTCNLSGGGICALIGTNTLTMTGCVVSNNVANPSQSYGSFYGGGIYISGNPQLKNCIVCDNTCRAESARSQTQYSVGGGLYISTGTAVIENCVFAANTSVCGTLDGTFSGWPAYGGGIYIQGGSLAMNNSILSSNVTSSSYAEYGAGLGVSSSVTNSSVVNCTFAYNNALGIYSLGTQPLVMNSILFFNNGNGSQISGPTNVTYCDVQGGFAGVGNINFNPIFQSTTNLIIVLGSPCIDAGNPNPAYDDTCFPPSLGTATNDIGAHGGPGACGWFIVPEVTWPNPQAITYGTPLGSNQLNATASVPGTFTYTPLVGTILNSGSNQTLSVLFTPTDTYINVYFSYTTAMVSVTLDVLPAPLTITATNQSKTYGQTLSFSGTEFDTAGLVNGDTVTSAVIASAGSPPTAPVSASPYAITITNAVGDAGLTNYTITYVNGALTVNPGTLTITANNQSKAYGAALPALTVNYTGFVNGDTAASLTTQPTVTTTATIASHVLGNPYAITASGAIDANYTISYVPGTLTVTPAPLTITANNQIIVYGSPLPSLTVAYGGFLNGDTSASLTTPPTVTTLAPATPPVGSYPILPGGAAGDPDYTFSYAAGTLTVTPAPLTITANNQSKVYEAPLPPLTVSYSGFVNGDTSASLTMQPTVTTTATAASPVGSSYPITATGAVDANYTISYVAGTLTITQIVPLVVWTNPPPIIYGISLTTNQLNATANLPGSLAYTPTNGSVPDAGTNTLSVIFTPTDTVDYATVTNTVSLVVSPAPLTITANNQSKAYGAALPALTVGYSGFVNGDTSASLTTSPMATTPATAASPVDGYLITISGAVDPNYIISYVTGTLTVTPVALTITANNQSKVYEAALPVLTVSYSGFVNGDTSASLTAQPTVMTTATATSPVDGYTITASGAVDANYTISYVVGTLTITQIVPVVAWSNPSSIIYGAPLTTNQLNATANVPGGLAYIPTNGSVLDAGTNTLSVIFTPTDSVDYAITTNTVSLIVSNAPLTVMASNFSRPFGTPNPVFTGTITGLMNGDNITATYSCSATISSSAGTYAIVPGLVDPNDRETNYTVTLDDATLTITPAPSGQSLNFAVTAQSLIISWPVSTTGYTLQMTTNLSDPNSWIPYQSFVIGGQNEAIVNTASGFGFFRLKQ